MDPIGSWNNIKHYSKVRGVSYDDFSMHMRVNPVIDYQLQLIGKEGYSIILRNSPNPNMKEDEIIKVSNKEIIISMPQYNSETDSFNLVSTEGAHISYKKYNFFKLISAEILTCLMKIWKNMMPSKVYLEYINHTMG